MPLGAGDYNVRVTLQSVTTTRVQGVPQTTRATIAADVPANVVPITGREFWESQRLNTLTNWRVTIRYRTDIEEEDEVLYGTRVLEIFSILPDEWRRMETVLMCREVNRAA